jgi:hypothetical protein
MQERIREIERAFRRAGLPNLIEGYSAAEDVFTRALPFLTLVFLLEILNALNLEWIWWRTCSPSWVAWGSCSGPPDC